MMRDRLHFVARMSEATSGKNATLAPDFAFAHPGYGLNQI
jgi:hypothetical protein